MLFRLEDFLERYRRPKMRGWSQYQAAYLLKFAETVPVEVIGREIGKTPRAIYSKAARDGIKLFDSRVKHSAADVCKCIELHRSGVKLNGIAEQTGILLSTVKTYVYGERRKPGGYFD